MKIHIVLDNLRSAFNVGSIFRSSDGAGSVEKIYLCGITSPIDNPKLEKTALGSLEFINSEHYEITLDAIKELKEQDIPIYSVELTDDSKDFQEMNYPDEFALVFGHEKKGIDQKVLDISDKIISLPMRGKKKSLNVANTASIILYEVTRDRK